MIYKTKSSTHNRHNSPFATVYFPIFTPRFPIVIRSLSVLQSDNGPIIGKKR